MRLVSYVGSLVVVVLATSAVQADIVSSDDFSFGFGVTSQTGNPWTATENAGNNSTTTQGDFMFQPAPSNAVNDFASAYGPTFLNRTLATGTYPSVRGYDVNFALPITAKYVGAAPANASATPNYRLAVNITELSVWGQLFNTTAEDTIAWTETTLGNPQTSPAKVMGLAHGIQATLANAGNYEHLNWDAGTYQVSLGALGDTVQRTFTIWLEDTTSNWCALDGLQVKGNVSLIYDAVPEPSMFVLLSVGLVSLLAYAWKKRR